MYAQRLVLNYLRKKSATQLHKHWKECITPGTSSCYSFFSMLLFQLFLTIYGHKLCELQTFEFLIIITLDVAFEPTFVSPIEQIFQKNSINEKY